MKALRISFATFVLLFVGSWAVADEGKGTPGSSQKLDRVTKRLTAQTYDLKYKFRKGEEVRYDVVHLVTMETRIKGLTKVDKSRSVSTKLWKISDIDTQGNATFVYFVEKANMWSQSGKTVFRYNSEKDKSAPRIYETVASSIGVPISRVTINDRGKIVKRANLKPVFQTSIGGLTIPLPPKAVKIGATWFKPSTIQVTIPKRGKKRIKARELYTLKSVKDGVAEITLKTQILTPVNSPQIKSQLIQMIKQGTIRFNISQGRVESIHMDFDDMVLAFAGAESLMKYLARFTEKLQTSKPAARSAKKIEAKLDRTGKPKFRR